MMPIHTSSPAQPSQQLTYSYRNREQRANIQQTVQRMRYDHPDVTCVSYYSGPNDGTVRIELSSLKEADGPLDNEPLKDDEPNEKRTTLMDDLRRAAEWLKKALKKQELEPEEHPAENRERG